MMTPFQRDEVKAAKNHIKHGITFEAARFVFKDPCAIDLADDRQDDRERRSIILGMVKGRVLFVVYTMIDDTIRIISARLAVRVERRRYHEENQVD
jgi:uncharacterized protein